mgnify:CR=1 FL=1
MKNDDHILSIIEKDLENKLREYIDKRFEIEQKYIELSQIKKDVYKLKDQKTEWEDQHPDLADPQDDFYKTEAFKAFDIVEQSGSDKGAVYLKKYKSEFSRILRKEFNKLGVKKKRELFKTGLLKVRFYLNYIKYEKINKEGKETELDKYVYKRSENFPYYLNIKFNDETIKKLEKVKQTEIENSKLAEDDRDYQIEDLEMYEDSEIDFSIDFEDDDQDENY